MFARARLVPILCVAFAAASCASPEPEPEAEPEAPATPEGDDEDAPALPTDSAIEITSPARGAFIAAASGATVEVVGKVTDGVRPLTINGTPVSYAADGSFSAVITPEPGTNLIVAQLGTDGARAQRSFVYGTFASRYSYVPSGVALRVNDQGYDDGYSDVDDLSTIAEEALAARKVMTLFPSQFALSVPVVGTVNVYLPSRTASRPSVALSPRSGGLRAAIALPSIKVSYDVSFGCLFATCHITGDVTATRADVAMPINVSIASQTITLDPGAVSLSLVGFNYSIDGSLGDLAKTVLDYFVPDLRQRLEGFLRQQISKAIPDDVGFALSQLEMPSSVTLPPPLSGKVNFGQRFDAASFTSSGSTIGAAVRASAVFPTGSPGADAPGWFQTDPSLGSYRTLPAFGLSLANDLVNQILYAAWGQGGFDIDDVPGMEGLATPLGPLGKVAIRFSTPPIIVGAQDELRLGVGDVIVTTTVGGEPFSFAASLTSALELSVSTVTNTARLEAIGDPRLVVEVFEAPFGFTTGQFGVILETLGTPLVADMIETVRVPIPRIPLAGVAPAYSTKTLELASPAEVVIGAPAGRVTLYGRLSTL